MSRHIRASVVMLLASAAASLGCVPTQPFYLSGRPGDMSYYLDRATDMESPDSDAVPLAEAEQATAPLTLSEPEPRDMWDLTLEDAISTALQNSKVIRRAFHVSGGQFTTGVPTLTTGFIPFNDGSTIYDPAAIESDPNLGVEAALSAFDAQLTASMFWDVTDRPQNVVFFNAVTQSTVNNSQFQISKRTTSGGTFFVRETTNYDNGNVGGAFRALQSVYTAALEAEWRQPLLQGRGTAVNRVPIVLARIRTDVDLAELEANVRNLLKDTEDSYWNLMFTYRVLEAAKVGRDSTLSAWRNQTTLLEGGRGNKQDEAQAREQYYAFRAQVETALRDLYNNENALRFMMGLAASDGRLIRPITEPTVAPVEFEWSDVSAEALVRVPELRRQKWVIKARETELIQAKNQLLPVLNATGLYRWVGLGDELTAANRNGINFPAAGSRAFENLTEGNFQEVRYGVEFAMPVGYRRQLAGVRNSQLLIAREQARLEDAELQVSHLLTSAVRNADGWYQLMQTQFNRLVAAKQEERSRMNYFLGGVGEGTVPLNLLLDSQRRVAAAQSDYYRALIEYNKSIADIHFRKGSLLEFNGVQMAEGPWPQKAYFDALGRARQRAASFYMDYGWTRPRVISEGPIEQGAGDSLMPADGEMYEGQGEAIPPGRPTPPPNQDDEVPTPTADAAARIVPPASGARRPIYREGVAARNSASGETTVAWRDEESPAPRKTAAATAVIRTVAHDESTPAVKAWKRPQ